MPDIIRFSDMKNDHPLQLNGANDLLAIAVVSGGTETGYNSMTTTPNQLGAYAVTEQTFSNLTTTAKTVQDAINELKESGGGYKYSLTEHEAGTWVDGSTVYEKTIYYTGRTQGDQIVPHGITGITRILDYEVSVLDSDYSQYHSFFVLPRIDNAGLSIDYITDTDIRIKCSGLYGTRLCDWYITIRYLKTAT